MGNSKKPSQEKGRWPFSLESDDPRKWQHLYRDAVVIAQALQRHGFDPEEAGNIRSDQMHMIFMSEKIYTFEESVIYDIAVHLLNERHDWSYGSQG